VVEVNEREVTVTATIATTTGVHLLHDHPLRIIVVGDRGVTIVQERGPGHTLPVSAKKV